MTADGGLFVCVSVFFLFMKAILSFFCPVFKKAFLLFLFLHFFEESVSFIFFAFF